MCRDFHGLITPRVIAVCLFLLSGRPIVSASAAPANLNSPTGSHGIIMVDKVGGYVRFFAAGEDQEISSLKPTSEAGLKAHELAISPDHKFAYVTVYGDGIYGKNPHPGHTIAIIDLASRQLQDSIDIAPYQAPHGIQVDAAGMLYVTCDLSHQVLIIDPKSKKITAAIDTPGTGHWIALLADRSKIYVANKNDKPFVSVIDVARRRVVATIAMPQGTQGITASPDSKTVLAADYASPFIHVISTRTDTEIDSIKIQGAEQGLYKVFFSADGKTVLTCLPNGQVNLLDAADLHASQRVFNTGGSNLMGFAFAEGGKTALVANHGQGTVSRFDLKQGVLLGTFAAGEGVETLSYY